MKKQNELLIESVGEKVTGILKKFDQAINANLIEVVLYDSQGEIQGTRRAANKVDKLDYIEEEWNKCAEKLNELGIVIDADNY